MQPHVIKSQIIRMITGDVDHKCIIFLFHMLDGFSKFKVGNIVSVSCDLVLKQLKCLSAVPIFSRNLHVNDHVWMLISYGVSRTIP